MNQDAWDEARYERQMVAAEAVGFLKAMVRCEQIPIIHINAAKSIVDRWDAETQKMKDALQ